MKKTTMKTRNLTVGLLLFLAGLSFAQAQQMPISMSQVFRPRLINPARYGSKAHHNIYLAHQQRKMLVAGWRSISQFLNCNSQPMGRAANWGWGVNLVNDFEHTENRFNFTAGIAAQVIKTEKSRLSLGINLGVINWNSNYQNTLVYDRNDELLLSGLNFVELDAGAGIDYAISTKKVKFDLQGVAMQLPGNFLSDQLAGLRINPHAVLAGKLLFSPLHNVFVGPMAFYRNTIMREDTTLKFATTDVGLKLELDRQDIWVGGAYRINRGALSLAFGMQVFMTDTTAKAEKSGVFVDLNAGFSLPMGGATPFGPTMEIGLDINFGRPFANKDYSDTLRIIDGAFWKNDGNLNRHTDDFIAPNGPVGLRSTTYVTPRNVLLTYAFLDQSLQYVGTTPVFQGDSLQKVGMEWIGVDGLCEGIAEYVIKDALDPDSASVLNIDSLEALKFLTSVEFSASLQASEEEVYQLAEGTIYEGEFGTNNASDDTLFLDIIYNEVDTVIGVALNHYLNNLELAALKLHSMRKKMEYEMSLRYGETLSFQREERDLDTKALIGKKLVRINKLRITPNHPNQDAFQVNEVNLKFLRYEKQTVTEDGEIIPNDLPGNGRRKKGKRRNTGRRDRR